jgi:hypothetical protein
MMTRRTAALACATALTSWAAESKPESGSRIGIFRVPDGGLQPQIAVDDAGALHVIYYKGEGGHGDVFYVRSHDGGRTFSAPLRVNSQTGSAIAAGTIRGAQIALGRAGRVHVAWNGSSEADPQGPINPDSGKAGMPMLYARLNDAGKAFEPQRNLMHRSFGLDGGGSVAADRAGNVYVMWHGIGESVGSGKGLAGEARRQVLLTKSLDDGRSFQAEKKAWPTATGACGCCGMKVFADRQGNISALYRSATESVHRDIYLLASRDRGQNFQGSLVQQWNINACPMSSMDIAEEGNGLAGALLVGAWETAGQVYWTHFEHGQARAGRPIGAPGEGKGRKHPRIAVNRQGDVLLVWTEGTGWQKGGSLAWQVYDREGQPTGERGQLAGIPAWSFAAAMARRDNGGFSVLY